MWWWDTDGMDLTSSELRRPSGTLLCSSTAGIARDDSSRLQEPSRTQSLSSKNILQKGSLWANVCLFVKPSGSDRVRVSSILQWRRGCSVVYCPGWESSPAAGNTTAPGPGRIKRNKEEFVNKFRGRNRVGSERLTCAITSRDQLSPMLMGCVGLEGILLSFSAGLSRVGPNTVARLWRDILLTHSFSATLGVGRHRRAISGIGKWKS